MGQSISSLEWLNKNSLRAYPLKEDSSRFDLTETYSLVDDFLVDLVFVVNAHKDRRFFLKFLSVLGSVITGQVYDETDSVAATFTIDVSGHTRYKAYSMTGAGDYSGSIGKVVVGELSNLLSNPQGSFEFDLVGAELEPAVVIPDIRGVSSLSKGAEDEGLTFPQLRDHVLIADGVNTRVRVEEETNTIRIDAIEGAGLGPLCDCPEEEPLPECLATINGIAPDESFNFNIVGVGCISVTPTANGIKIANTCVENCCDCVEIDALEARLDALEAQQEVIQLTGTVTMTNGLTAVTGVGTNFGAEVAAGDLIQLVADGLVPGDLNAAVLSVDSPTAITLVAPYPGTGGSGAATRVRR